MRDTEYAALAFQIRSLAGISTKLMAQDFDERLAKYMPGISGPQYGVMRILTCNPSTISELSEHMRLAPSTLVPIVDRLEHEGMVVRGKDSVDRRRTPLMLTEHAREMLAQVPPVDMSDNLCRALTALGAEKSSTLSVLLQELIGQLAPGHDIASQILAVSARLNYAAGSDPCSTASPETPAANPGVVKPADPAQPIKHLKAL